MSRGAADRSDAKDAHERPCSGPKAVHARRFLWWALLAPNLAMVVAAVAAAQALRLQALYLSATGPLLLVEVLAFLAWWDSRNPSRAALSRALRWATAAGDALLAANAATASHLGGRFAFVLALAPLLPAALFTLLIWKQTSQSS